MPVTIDGTNGITNGGGYTGDGVSFADATPANTLVTTTGGNVGIGTNNPNFKLTVNGNFLNTYTTIAPGNTTSEFVGMSLSNPYTSGTGVSFIDAQGRNNITDSHIFFIHYADYGSAINFATQPAGTNTDRRVERMRITPDGNVGIGTSLPGTKLDVYGTSATDIFHVTRGTTYFTAGVTDGSQVELNAYQNGVGAKLLALQSAGGITSFGGNVGIGMGSPSYQLQLSTNSAAKPTSNVWTVASDERVKTVTGEYTKGLDAVCSLRPVTYKYNGKAGFVADGSENISIIAQEAIEAFPECIGTFSAKLNETDEEETELLNWDGHALTFALVNAIKELKAQNEDLRARLAAVEGAIA